MAIWQSQLQQKSCIARATKCTRGLFQCTNYINGETAIPERNLHGARKIRMMVNEESPHSISYQGRQVTVAMTHRAPAEVRNSSQYRTLFPTGHRCQASVALQSLMIP
ncbi:hypothetical protein [Sinorhizobium meliloti]|uniref:hypothetical protein n=1 Tax=Rhizobium meliloti TaxID=382 RepID=UPI002090778B|nr:hypothetical protein [Sinorhizobium meliloti]MCO5966746.1 hypothetical protein [Sinorhizobium meliloti]